MLGHQPKVPQDVFEVFAYYVEGKVPHIPWCETPLQPESLVIQSQLAELNRSGFLTINSQPSVNGKPSSDKIFGWGGAGGFVYQKEYCECFCSPKHANALVEMVKNYPSMNLYAVNIRGEEIRVGLELGGVTALTWGVFPNRYELDFLPSFFCFPRCAHDVDVMTTYREILQPTIFDPSAFLVWSEEAFSLWSGMWLNLYEMGSESYELIEEIRDTYFLVAIIDNDFVSKDGESSLLWQAMLDTKKNFQKSVGWK